MPTPMPRPSSHGEKDNSAMSKPFSCGLLVATPIPISGAFSAFQADSRLFARLEMDWEHLYQLADGCPEFAVELLDLFVQDSTEQLHELRQAIAQQNYILAERVAHYLKGASGNVGINAMYAIAAQLEHQLRQQQWHGADALVNRLAGLLQDVKALLTPQVA